MKRAFPNSRTLIIFTGGPGTGKSGTAERFLSYLGNDEIIKISYDRIKEKNWDIFGFDDEKQKDRLNWFSLEEFYLTIQKGMWENRTILIEYPFYQRHKPQLQALLEESGYDAVTICLYAEMKTVYQRSVVRDREEERHPGHLLSCYHKETYTPDMLDSAGRITPTFEEFTAAIAHKEYNIALGLALMVDVTDFRAVSYEELYQKILRYQEKKRMGTPATDEKSCLTGKLNR